jgi:hypothetical protein
MHAANSSASLSEAEANRRNAVLNRYLVANDMRAVNVAGDGNCYFRALSVCLYNNEEEHLKLRQSIIKYILQSVERGEALPGIIMDVTDASVLRELDNLKRDGTEVGEDVIVATAAYLHRPVYVFSFNTATDAVPLIYQPAQCLPNIHPIRLAFCLPGHYQAVFCKDKDAHPNGSAYNFKPDYLNA